MMARGKVGDGNGSSRANDIGVVVEWIVREVGDGMAFFMLTKTNYTDWAMLMCIKLKVRGLWVTVDKGGAIPRRTCWR
jgi:hypothetical protein